MSSKAKKKKNSRRPKSGNAPIRVVDVKQAMAQQVHDAAFVKLDRLLRTEPGQTHLALAADVFVTGMEAAQAFRFLPEEPAAFLELMESILERLAIQTSPAMGESKDAAARASRSDPKEKILESANQLRILVGTESGTAITDPILLQTMSDQAILKPELRRRLPTELAEEVQRVAEALEHVESNQDDSALSILETISFRSVMAPWRLLVRGMVHFYAGRTHQAEEAWKRLPKDRLPHGVARAMLGTVNRALADQPKVDQRQLTSLVKDKQPDVEETRARLLEWFEHDMPDKVVEAINDWARKGWVAPSILNSLRDRVYSELILMPDMDSIRQVAAHLPPPAWDPKLQFPTAIAEMLAGDPTEHGNRAAMDQYLESVQSNPNLSDSDRTAVTAAVHAQIALLLGSLLFKFSSVEGPTTKAEKNRIEVGGAIGRLWAEQLLKCVQLHPQWDEPLQHVSVAELDNALRPGELIGEIHQTRLKDREDDFEVVREAATFFVEHDLERARPLVQQLIRLAPRDDETRQLVWILGRLSFLNAIRNSQLTDAKEHLESMSAFLPLQISPGVIELYRAIVDLAENNDADIEPYLAKSHELGVPRLAGLFLMELIAAKGGLPANLRKGFRDTRKPLSKRPSLKVVEETCRLVGQSLVAETEDFPGRIGSVKELIATTKRALTQSSHRQWNIEMANEIGTFVVFAKDDVLRRQFLRAIGRHSEWHIFGLVQALEGGVHVAFYHLQDVVMADKDHPNGLPAPLRPIARTLFQAGEEQRHGEFLDDFDDFGEISDELHEMDELGEELLETIPAEMVLAFQQEPQAMEVEMRSMMPGHIVDMLIKILCERAKA